MSAHVDGCLDPAGEQRLADHLAACAACRLDLEALQHTVKLLQQMEPVAPPPSLTAQIRARIRRSRRSTILAFLSLPQTRVALAASLLIVLTTLGIRQMYASRPVPEAVSPREEERAPVAPASCAAKMEPAAPQIPDAPSAPAVAAPSKPAQAARDGECEKRAVAEESRAEKAAAGGSAMLAEQQSIRTDQGMPQQQEALGLRGRSASRAVAGAREGKKGQAALRAAVLQDALPAEGAAAASIMPGLADGGGAGDDRKAVSAPQAQTSGRDATAAAEPASFRRPLPDGYTFRTDRPADAAAVVNRHIRKTAPGAAADKQTGREGVLFGAMASARPVVMEVNLPSAEIAALVDDLRQAGAVLVDRPMSADAKRRMGASPESPRGNMARNAAPATGLAAASAPATNILARFIFLPPEQ